MTQPQIPPQMAYGSFRPKGYYTQFRQWPITPMSSNQYWSPDQIVRFLITIKNGVMDPYRSHIQMQVSCSPQNHPVGSLQIDNSAQSFISQTVVSSNNIQIQRITQYDTLAAYLTDIGFSQYVCQSRQSQGLGYSNIPSHYPFSTTTLSSGQTTYSFGPQLKGKASQQVQTGLAMPSRMSSWVGKTNIYTSDGQNQGILSNVFQGNAYSQNPSLSNYLWQRPNYYNLQTSLDNDGRFLNVRSEYFSGILQNDYPDVSYSKLMLNPQVLNQTYVASQITSNSSLSGYNPKAPYNISFQNGVSTNILDINSGQLSYQTIPNRCGLWGFQKPISGQYSRGTRECYISPTIPQCQMKNGQILSQKFPVSMANFNIPLISTICGILIPPDQFLLIPMQSLYNLLLQVTLSRFAMFTSGYSDVHQFDQRGMQNMQQRNWLISEIYWNIHLYTFADQGVNKQIEASLVRGIPVSSTSYALASQFQLPSGQSVRNAWPIATQAESLCQIICIFLSNQYQQYTFCRKQFRLSNCVSSMQIKLNTQFYPSQPLIGNAGNPQTIDQTGDVWPFYQLLLLSSNYLFNTNIPLPKINTKNFCVNGRCYNTDNTRTHYDKEMFNNSKYTWKQNSVNNDTAMGYSSFHQNRYVGKAAYVYSWEPYGHSKQYMTGINTQGVQNFQVVFNTNNDKPYPKDQTLLIFTRQNVIVVYQAGGVRVIGK